jgi:hypothetical protein
MSLIKGLGDKIDKITTDIKSHQDKPSKFGGLILILNLLL